MTVQKVEIKDAKNTIVVQKASGAVTAAVITHHDAVSKTVAKKFDDVARHEQAQLDAIANQPATPNAPSEPSTLPPTPQAQQVSAVHIAAVWDNYCLAAPAAAECQASPKETAQ